MQTAESIVVSLHAVRDNPQGTGQEPLRPSDMAYRKPGVRSGRIRKLNFESEGSGDDSSVPDFGSASVSDLRLPSDSFLALTRKNHQPSAATCGRQAGAALGLDCGADGMFSSSPSTILRPPCSSLPNTASHDDAASRDEVGDLSGLSAGWR